MFGILLFVTFYSLIAGAWYALTKNELEALFWGFYIPFNIGTWFIKILKLDGKEEGTDTKGNKD